MDLKPKENSKRSHLGVDKLFYKTMLKDLFSDPCSVRFWDGEEETYGEGAPRFRLIFNEPIPKADLIADPSLALGEAYMHGIIDVEGSLRELVQSIYCNRESFLRQGHRYNKALKLISNNKKRSKENVQHHYDIGNDFYKLWLDETMTYSCGYFCSGAQTLNEAQTHKIDHILKKLNLKEGQKLLDIGCGWGQLMLTAAKKYPIHALGITLSQEQYEKVKERIKAEGLEDRLEVELTDYRELSGKTFDRIVSVGMLEHVGKDHLEDYFSHVSSMLREGGVSLLHCITGIHEGEGGTNSWINKYIFPGGYIPAIQELIRHITNEELHLVDVESLRRHYGKTLEHWAENYEAALPEIRKTKDEVFIRMWRLYLNSCAASFYSGNIDIHQFLFTKGICDDIPMCRDYLYR